MVVVTRASVRRPYAGLPACSSFLPSLRLFVARHSARFEMREAGGDAHGGFGAVRISDAKHGSTEKHVGHSVVRSSKNKGRQPEVCRVGKVFGNNCVGRIGARGERARKTHGPSDFVPAPACARLARKEEEGEGVQCSARTETAEATTTTTATRMMKLLGGGRSSRANDDDNGCRL